MAVFVSDRQGTPLMPCSEKRARILLERGRARVVREKPFVIKGKKAGVHVGRVAIRATGSFNIQTASGTVQGIRYKYCRILQRGDGYSYHVRAKAFLSV